ncbi:hypothetical protein Tco_1360479 [Tanacetum coccineum]
MQGVSHITFFECSFSSQCGLWFRVLCGMDAISPHLSNVVAFIVPLSKGKIVVSIIFRIVVAATSYYIWLERNVDVQEEDFDPEEESMRKMVMMRKMKVIEDLNNEKDERKWQSMVLEMKIEEIVCSKREIPARV